ncbi:hypothetical protein L1286_12950 [Pseudoalteromonas sp. SMS1]|uniref:hypothetical protein n=1 Tax=Pseudoalteromonas sp. SMS1 TaxID=2908894 RepID=UPI001F3A6432|nr:hypothetical protein [Pseudoalteromonas sp. SMS1]MCF2858389.1 hypothetical protein [Pseudoalteromonas sp. SMS1]
MNVQNLPAGYTSYSALLDPKKDMSKNTTETEKAESEKINSGEENSADDKKSEEVKTKDERVQSILSLQQKIKSLQLKQDELSADQQTLLADLKHNLEEELAQVQSFIRGQASTYVSGLFSNSPALGNTHSGMFLSSKV